MSPGALRQQGDAEQDEYGNHGRGKRTAERETAVIYRLVEQVADRGVERAYQDAKSNLGNVAASSLLPSGSMMKALK